MAKTGTFPVKQGIDPRYLQSILTKDATVLEGIYDLIDNSIDAARDRLLGRKISTDAYGLPASYAGFSLSLRFGRDSITFVNNGAGIAEKALASRAFVVGASVRYRFGLGSFGIGLKRSLIRLCNRQIQYHFLE